MEVCEQERQRTHRDHLKLCLTTTNKNAKKQTEFLSCVETFHNNGEVCACVGGREGGEGRGWQLKCNLAKPRKDTACTERADLESLIPTQRENCAVSREKSWYSSWGELTTKGDESAQRLKTSTGSVKPARTLQELQGSQTGNRWV